jgi:hypothetical protein
MLVVHCHFECVVSCRGRSPLLMLVYMHVVGSELDRYKNEAHCDWIEWKNNER